MTEKKNNQSPSFLLLLGLLFFPLKIVVVYFTNCFKDVFKAVSEELTQTFKHSDDQRWGR